MGTVHTLLNFIMRLGSVLIFLSFTALSSALFGPVPYLSQIAAAKAGLLATKSLLLGHLFRRKSKDNCEDEMETIVEVVCNPTTTQECQNEPQEECQDTLIEVCKVVDEELCEEVEENVCEQVSKQECGESVKVCRTEQKCHTIIEKKCDTDQEDAKNNQEDIKLFLKLNVLPKVFPVAKQLLRIFAMKNLKKFAILWTGKFVMKRQPKNVKRLRRDCQQENNVSAGSLKKCRTSKISHFV